MCGEAIVFVFIVIFVGYAFGLGMVVGDEIYDGIRISQDTADDICRNLTGNESAEGYGGHYNPELEAGKFGCKLPSYDSTQNIIIKTNSE